MVSYSYETYAIRQTILNYLLLYLKIENLKGLTMTYLNIFGILKDYHCTFF